MLLSASLLSGRIQLKTPTLLAALHEVGGEGAIPPETGFFYPIVVQRLAPRWHAAVLQPEHRFYGTSGQLPRRTGVRTADGDVEGHDSRALSL